MAYVFYVGFKPLGHHKRLYGTYASAIHTMYGDLRNSTMSHIDSAGPLVTQRF